MEKLDTGPDEWKRKEKKAIVKNKVTNSKQKADR
jgi:hypothetical protein